MFCACRRRRTFRGVAQLVERHVRDVEAAGSRPVTPIRKARGHYGLRAFFRAPAMVASGLFSCCTVHFSDKLNLTVRKACRYCQIQLTVGSDSTGSEGVLSDSAHCRIRQYEKQACTVDISCIPKLTVSQSLPVLSISAHCRIRQYRGWRCTVNSSLLRDPTVRGTETYCRIQFAPKSDSTEDQSLQSGKPAEDILCGLFSIAQTGIYPYP